MSPQRICPVILQKCSNNGKKAKSQLEKLAFCLIIWLLDLGSNQGPTD